MNKTKFQFLFVLGLLLSVWPHYTFGQTRSFWDSLYIDSTSLKTVFPVDGYSNSPYLVNKQLDALLDSVANERRKANLINGFRILLYSGNDREKASKAKEMAYRLIRNSNVYTSYQSPTFKVKLGDYYQKIDAYLALKKIVSVFPKAVIIQEVVKLKN